MLLVFVARAQTASPRTVTAMNEGWQFIKGDSSLAQEGWQTVRLPHTWNIADVMDDVPGYYRGAGWYRKTLHISKELKGKDVFLCFEGANQETAVFVNGKKAGEHTGGYTGFSVPLSSFLNFDGDNELLVKVDNSYNASIAPLSADFTFYGGLYRNVFLLVTNKVHFGDRNYGSAGVYITTPLVSNEKAVVTVKSIVYGSVARKLKVISVIYDRSGVKVSELSSVVPPGSGETVVQQKMPVIVHPVLWSPEEPYLYRVETRIVDEKGRIIDLVKNPLGLRWFSFDADKGFFLNGAPYKLVGASRHQDYKGLGNAVPKELAVQDVVLLKKMGGNFLRVAHYPQDPCVLAACDSLGLLASVEIPVVNEITESDSFYRNCEQMQTEMIRQNYNHPAVVLWCYMNEVLLRSHFNDNKERQKLYFSNVAALAQRLDSLTRREDPYRYTMMADHGNLAQYKNAGLLQIPMVIGWNLYNGWYGGSMEDFPQFLDDFHAAWPTKPFMVTEYGADADPRIRSVQPVRFDKSIEYTTHFHQYYLTEMLKRPYVAGAVVWNLADFNSETRTETMPHINNKGLLQWDRTPKDPYYFYEARLSRQPFIKILGSGTERHGVADSASAVCYQLLQVASNLDSVEIRLNGKAQTKLAVVDGLCEWKLPFAEGINTVIVGGRKGAQLLADSMTTHFHLQPHCLTDSSFAFSEMNVMLGSNRCFVDEKGGWWQPDQTYCTGSWGSIGGKTFKLANNGRLPYGTDKDIMATEDDPVYQTQQTGIAQYRLEVPPGVYELTLHFAELLGGTVKLPPYNLVDGERHEKTNRRIFNVQVNGKAFLEHFNIADDYGLATAVTRSTKIIVHGKEGVFIDFEAVEGEPVLNALQLKKIADDIEK
jgi:beta-galactosidase